MTDLIQIEIDTPPLHQSTVYVMACPLFYITVRKLAKRKKRLPASLESSRGNEVHAAMSRYVAWCAYKEKKMDPIAFDEFAKGAGPLAAKILAGIRDTYEVDFGHLLLTETTMALDDDLQPTNVATALEAFVADSGNEPAYEGTPDAIFAFKADRRMQIVDYKTHPRPFEPGDTVQAKEYTLFCFQHFPWVETVVFQLVFVRYRNMVRSVTYTRDDIPMLVDAVRSARARQLALHESYKRGEEIPAIPGPQCQYCPLLANKTCPIAEFNPAMQFTPEERLRFALWYREFSKVNNEALKAYIQATGRSVKMQDGNGRWIKYGPVETESMVFPLFEMEGRGKYRRLVLDNQGRPKMPVVELLLDYVHSEESDQAFLGNLVISATKLNEARRTNKRVDLDQALQDTMPKIPKSRLKASKPLETLEDEDEDELDEYELDEEDEEE